MSSVVLHDDGTAFGKFDATEHLRRYDDVQFLADVQEKSSRSAVARDRDYYAEVLSLLAVPPSKEVPDRDTGEAGWFGHSLSRSVRHRPNSSPISRTRDVVN